MYEPNRKDAIAWNNTPAQWTFIVDLCAEAGELGHISIQRVDQVEEAFTCLLVNTPSPEPSDPTDLTREQYMGISQATEFNRGGRV